MREVTALAAGPHFRAWLIGNALPLWMSVGFDADAPLFEEQLDLERRPVRTVPRRVMVQARQISVCALATRSGWADLRAPALAVGAAVIERYWAADGAPGWVFALDRAGEVADSRRDLYAHAFVLFALGNLLKLAPGEPSFLQAVERTVTFLEEAFADPIAGGYWDCLPRADALRRQNPHMHLLEAWLELFEATGEHRFLDRAEQLVRLARACFLDPRAGTLREFFDDRWQVSPAPGQGIVEPGHQFEWAWLFRRYERLAGGNEDGAVTALVRSALTHGVDPATGRILDQVGEDGAPLQRSSRCWPYCEAVKSLAVETARGGGDHRALIDAMLNRLLAAYCRADLHGGWIDHLDEQDRAASKVMPASTLYHLAFALAEWEAAFGSDG